MLCYYTIIEDKSRTDVMDKDKGEPVISVKTEEKKEEDGEKKEENAEDKDKKPEGEKTEGASEEHKTEGNYSKTCLQRPLKKKTKIGFQDQF